MNKAEVYGYKQKIKEMSKEEKDKELKILKKKLKILNKKPRIGRGIKFDFDNIPKCEHNNPILPNYLCKQCIAIILKLDTWAEKIEALQNLTKQIKIECQIKR